MTDNLIYAAIGRGKIIAFKFVTTKSIFNLCINVMYLHTV